METNDCSTSSGCASVATIEGDQSSLFMESVVVTDSSSGNSLFALADASTLVLGTSTVAGNSRLDAVVEVLLADPGHVDQPRRPGPDALAEVARGLLELSAIVLDVLENVDVEDRVELLAGR